VLTSLPAVPRDDAVAFGEGHPDEIVEVRVQRVLLLEPRHVPHRDDIIFKERCRPRPRKRRRQLRGLARDAATSKSTFGHHRFLRCGFS
jgi:hypothetical protein